jgi:hypothetical protein
VIGATYGFLAGEREAEGQPAELVFQGAATVELLQRIRTLLEHLDKDDGSPSMPRNPN